MQANEFNRIQEDILRGRAKSAERVGWFSGASISLSFTLLGFLISKGSFIYLIQTHVLLLGALILGWIFLGISIISSLLISFLSEKWLYDKSCNLYLSANADAFAQEINKINPNLAKSSGEKANTKALLLRIVERAIYIGGVVGIFLLVLFLIELTITFIFCF